ncbi:hypothetical protein C2845_PM01G15540 [Panicum miliaceum]|uniref:1-phosphatidylinositol-4-phosphate 5-kinase n=1 Tax=Panicum miliaceum TaxID=4540 RepID=A0A3L6TGD6_PANMI|nr:hypothetical protein C2845_PM01G15540 [Panicum miliaceum]
MGTTRAALRRGGARVTRDEDNDDEKARRDGEGGGRWRWEGAAAAVAGDGALRRRQVARPAAAGRDHRQGPQELRAHAQPAARHQIKPFLGLPHQSGQTSGANVLLLGKLHAVGKQGPITLDLKSSAFDPKEKVWTRFHPEGSKYTPPHSSCDFKWKDYCPQVFRTLRKLFKVDAADYMLSLCGDQALRELSSPGKSGSFFYLTSNDQYMIKTMKKSEVKIFLKMLRAYYNHVRAFENTLVTKFFGLHCVKLAGANQKKVRFVIMGNLFCSEYPIHRRFDLKGSSLGRTTDKPQTEIDEYTTLKDLDLNFIFRLQKHWCQEFQRQVDRDCEFLEQENIMDYSLLVGVHFRDTRDRLLTGGSFDSDRSRGSSPHLSRGDTDANRFAKIKLGSNMPIRAERTIRKSDIEPQIIGEPTGEFYDVVLYFGIIDILQDYDISKKLEHAYKSFQYDPTSISAVDPKQYSRRFRDFVFKAFQEEKFDL